MKKHIPYICLLLSLISFSQKTDQLISEGNASFQEKEYTKAELKYRQANAQKTVNTQSAYNLGTTICTLNQYSEAKNTYKKVIETSSDKNELHRTFHNLGNIFMKEKKYSEAVAAYKDALRNNPADDETRYNLALAKELLKKNPPKDDKKNDKDKKDQDKKEDKKDQQEKKKEDDKKDGQKNKDNNENKDPKEDNKSPEQQEGKFSKQRMESLLEAINNEEKKVQKKIIKQKTKENPTQQDKNW